MADDDAKKDGAKKDGAKKKGTRKPRAAKKPAAKPRQARVPVAGTRAKPGRAKTANPALRTETAKTEPHAAPGRSQEARPDATLPASDSITDRPLLLALIGGLVIIAVLAALALSWPGGRDRVAQLFSGSTPVVRVAAPSPEMAPAPGPGAPGLGAAPAPSVKLAQRLDTLEGTLARLASDIADLKSALAAAGDPGKALSAFEPRIMALEQAPKQNATTEAALGEIVKRLEALGAGVKALEDRPAGAPVASGAEASLALVALAGALRRGSPHGVLGAAVRGLIAKSDPGGGLAARLDVLAEYASKGVPVLAALVARLNALPQAISGAEAGAEPGPQTAPAPAQTGGWSAGGWWEKVRGSFSELVVIRRVGEMPASEPRPRDQARLKASRALAAGDLAGALAALKDAGGSGFAAWRQDAGARLKADALADELDAVIARRLGRGAVAP